MSSHGPLPWAPLTSPSHGLLPQAPPTDSSHGFLPQIHGLGCLHHSHLVVLFWLIGEPSKVAPNWRKRIAMCWPSLIARPGSSPSFPFPHLLRCKQSPAPAPTNRSQIPLPSPPGWSLDKCRSPSHFRSGVWSLIQLCTQCEGLRVALLSVNKKWCIFKVVIRHNAVLSFSDVTQAVFTSLFHFFVFSLPLLSRLPSLPSSN